MSAEMQRSLELRRAAAVGLTEGGAEMAVAGKAQLQPELGEVVARAQQIERATKPQAQLMMRGTTCRS